MKEGLVVGQLEKEASQTRDYCVAKNATDRAARPDSLDFARDRLFAAQRTLVQYDSRTAELLSERALKQGIELVPNHAIDHEGTAGIGDLVEKKLGPTVSVDIDGIDQVEAGNDVEMLG